MMTDRQLRAQQLVAHGLITADRACAPKVAYPTRNEARHAAKDVARRQGRVVDVYRCPFCTCFHVTKRRHGEEDEA